MFDEASIRIRAARLWLSEGYTTPEKVRTLHRTLAASRGQDYADAMRDEMRAQWRTRAEWLEPTPDKG